VTVALIDLDATPAPRPARRRSRPFRGLLVLGLLLAVSLGGATAPPSPPPAPVILAGDFADYAFLQGNRLFVVSPGRGGTQILRTYRLPGAALAGQVTIGLAGGSVSGVAQAGGTLLVAIGDPSVTLAVDATTGRELWEFGAAVVGVSPGTVLLSSAPTQSDAAVWALDARSGEVRWRVRQPDGGLLTLPGLPSFSGMPSAAGRAPADLPRWLIATTAKGLVTAYDTGTGRPIATVRATPPDVTYASSGQFVVGSGSAGLAAYALPPLTRRWHAPVDPGTDLLQADCVAVLCAYHGEDGVSAVDPATGRTLWNSDVWTSLEPLGSSLVAAVGEGSLEGLRLTVLDPVTGRSRGDFGGWRAIGGPDGSIRYAQHPGPVTYFGELDPASRTVRLLGQVAGLSGHCDAAGGALICRRLDGSLAIWPIPVRGGVS
jgi:outer membrane protein assembly factor BamB